MPIEGHLVGGGSIRNGIHANAANAALTEKLRSGRDNTLPRGIRSSEVATEISFNDSDFFADEVLDIDVTDR